MKLKKTRKMLCHIGKPFFALSSVVWLTHMTATYQKTEEMEPCSLNQIGPTKRLCYVFDNVVFDNHLSHRSVTPECNI